MYSFTVFIGRSSNGRTEAFEAFNLGSIPSLPAEEDFFLVSNILALLYRYKVRFEDHTKFAI